MVEDYGLSNEHRCITIEISKTKPQSEKVLLKNKLNTAITNIAYTDFNSIDDFQKLIKREKRNATRKSKRTPKFYWSKSVEDTWKILKEKKKVFGKTGSSANRIEFMKAAAIFKRTKHEATINYLNQLPEEIKKSNNAKRNWEIIGRFTGKNRKKLNNPVAADKHLATQFMQENYIIDDQETPKFISTSTDFEVINPNDWYNFINTRKDNSAPGADGITYGMLKKLNEDTTNKIIHQLNEMWKRGEVSENLKEVKIVAIPKPNNEGARPISLLPTLLKVLNRAVLNKMMYWIKHENLLPDTSFGYRAENSSETCLSFVTNEIMQNVRKKNITAVIFFDFSKAFNKVNPDILIEIMRNKVPNEFLQYVESFLKNRKTFILTNEGKASFLVSRGVPQGDIMSPMLFNVYTAEFHRLNNHEGVKIAQYADDFAAIISVKNKNELEDRVNMVVREFCEIAENLQLQLNSGKTKIMVVKRRINIHATIDNTIIENVKSYKYLGVVLDSYLCYSQHIKHIKQKLSIRLSQLKVINGAYRGAHPAVMTQVYKALMASVMNYGSITHAMASNTNIEALEIVNRRCLRAITGCTRTTPLNTLAALSGIGPIKITNEFWTNKRIATHLHRDDIIAKQLKGLHNRNDGRESRRPNNRTGKNWTYLERTYMNNIEALKSLTIKINNSVHNVKIISDIGIKINKNSLTSRVLKQHTMQKLNDDYKDHYKVYTDASGMEGNFGAGLYDQQKDYGRVYKLNRDSSIMTAELIGILKALEYLKENNQKHNVILTDSRSACEYLKTSSRMVKADRIAVNIIQMQLETNTTLQWVPSHVEINGNEIVDRMAKDAIDYGEEFLNEITLKDVIRKLNNIKNQKMDQWYVDYAMEKGRFFYQLQSKISDGIWYRNYKESARKTRMLNRILSGHDFSKHSLHLMRIEEDGSCESCGVPSTTSHTLFECSLWDIQRQHYNTLKNNRSIADAWKKCKYQLFEEILEFLEDNKIKA
jgi:ribonuclease HI